jgi:peroxiredoxin-like protein
MKNHVYVVETHWKQGRVGKLSTPDSDVKFEVATPPNFPKGVETIWSPEHLYTAAISSCLLTTFLAIAENSKLEFSDLKIEAKGVMEMVDGKYRMTEVQLYPSLTVPHSTDQEKATRLLFKAEHACLISRSVNAKISLHPQLIVLENSFSSN